MDEMQGFYRSCCISSTEARILVPDVRYSFVSNVSPFHSCSMTSMLLSSEYSFDAATQVYRRTKRSEDRTAKTMSEHENNHHS